MKWIDIWANAPSITEAKAEQYGKNITFTYCVQVPCQMSELKLRFSNLYGTEDVTIDCCRVHVISPEYATLVLKKKLVDYPLRPYDGPKYEDLVTESVVVAEKAILKAGEEVTTKCVACNASKGSYLVISFYLGDFAQLRSSVFTSGIFSGGFVTEGDATRSPILSGFDTISTNLNYFLTDVFAYTEDEITSIVCYGDSITAQDWPEYCYDAFLKSEEKHAAVVRKAASGTRLTGQYDCMQYRSYGKQACYRYPHEFVTEGAKIILIQHGINDIIHPVGVETNPFRPWSDLPKAEDMIQVYKEYIAFAREQKLTILLGTLLPIEGWRTYTPERDLLRNEVNEWIRTEGAGLVDGIVDFDLLVRDDAHPARFKEGFDCGDHLHPSKNAYKAMGAYAYECMCKLI